MVIAFYRIICKKEVSVKHHGESDQLPSLTHFKTSTMECLTELGRYVMVSIRLVNPDINMFLFCSHF